MIKITKGDPPEILEEAREDQQLMMEFYYDCSIVEYTNGELKFEFGDDYHSPMVKATLLERQHNKCCFSEAKFVGDFPHVEHFRPKGRVDIEETKERLYPGYYWLANSWLNLFLCKQVINVSYKKNYFPLLNEANRNRSHHDANIEAPLLLDPAVDEPRDHIKFHMDEPVHLSVRGKATIDLLALRDEPFSSARKRLLKNLYRIKETTEFAIDLLKKLGEDHNHPTVQENLETLKEAMQPHAEFSSMVKDFLKDWPPLQLALSLPQNL